MISKNADDLIVIRIKYIIVCRGCLSTKTGKGQSTLVISNGDCPHVCPCNKTC